MPWSSQHIDWLVDTGERLTTVGGNTAEVWELRQQANDAIMSAWAKHFRNHYCRDTEISELTAGTKYANRPNPRCDYLREMKFPDAQQPPGPSVRSGDFGEILIADFVEYVMGFWVPRTRFSDRTNRNDPDKGVDVIGLKFVADGDTSPDDALLLFESKCRLSRRVAAGTNRLQDAVDGSSKDYNRRKGESLNAAKQWFIIRGQKDYAKRIARFQFEEDLPYTESSGAAVVLSSEVYDARSLESADTREHPNRNRLILLVIRGTDMMELVNELYRRAADEA